MQEDEAVASFLWSSPARGSAGGGGRPQGTPRMVSTGSQRSTTPPRGTGVAQMATVLPAEAVSQLVNGLTSQVHSLHFLSTQDHCFKIRRRLPKLPYGRSRSAFFSLPLSLSLARLRGSMLAAQGEGRSTGPGSAAANRDTGRAQPEPGAPRRHEGPPPPAAGELTFQRMSAGARVGRDSREAFGSISLASSQALAVLYFAVRAATTASLSPSVAGAEAGSEAGAGLWRGAAVGLSGLAGLLETVVGACLLAQVCGDSGRRRGTHSGRYTGGTLLAPTPGAMLCAAWSRGGVRTTRGRRALRAVVLGGQGRVYRARARALGVGCPHAGLRRLRPL